MIRVKIGKWVLTPHAAERVLERNIKVFEINDILKNPDHIVQQGSKFILSKKISERNDNDLACVVVEKKGEDLWIVITVMIHFKIK